MASFRFNCPQCGHAIETDESLCGQVTECPHCEKGIAVPNASDLETKKTNERSKIRLSAHAIQESPVSTSTDVEFTTFDFPCPECGKVISFNDTAKGQIFECPHCGKGIVAPKNILLTSISEFSKIEFPIKHQGKEIILCPNCKGKLRIDSEDIWRFIKCPKCRYEFFGKESLLQKFVDNGVLTNGAAIPLLNMETGSIEVSCPYCKGENVINKNYLGQNVDCKSCGRSFFIDVGFHIEKMNISVFFQKYLSDIPFLINFPEICFGVEPYQVLCPICRTKYVKWGLHQDDLQNGYTIFYCPRCGLFSRLRDGVSCFKQYYIPLLSDVNDKIEDIRKELAIVDNQIEIIDAHNRFMEQNSLFDQEWKICQDPLVYDRLNFMINRIRARLTNINFEKVANAQRTATASNVAFGTTLGLQHPHSTVDTIERNLVQLGALSSLNNSEKERESIYSMSQDLESTLEQYEAMMNHYYDLKSEFNGRQKDEARIARLMARCQCSRKELLPEPNLGLPEDKNVLLNIKEDLLGRYSALKHFTLSTKNELKQAHERVNTAILIIGLTILIIGLIGIIVIAKLIVSILG